MSALIHPAPAHYPRGNVQLPSGICLTTLGNVQLPSGLCLTTLGYVQLPSGICSTTLGNVKLPSGICLTTCGNVQLPSGICQILQQRREVKAFPLDTHRDEGRRGDSSHEIRSVRKDRDTDVLIPASPIPPLLYHEDGVLEAFNPPLSKFRFHSQSVQRLLWIALQ